MSPWLHSTGFAAVVAAVLASHWALPPPLGLDAPARSFSAGRALEWLKPLADCGVKLVGTSMNEECAPAVLLRAIEPLRANPRVVVSVQRGSGSYFIDFLGGFQNTYTNVTNVVVRVKGSGADVPGCAAPGALLVSAHFDSAFGSPAASDDGAQISIMLETLRALLEHDPLPTDVIFNFNGGEEQIMQGAHAFITLHPWAKNVCAFINLEAAGTGGREVLLQLGPKNGWIAEAYQQVPRPFGFAVVQAVFESAIIPGETDFRVYRDFGHVAGIDLATTANGYAYHTSNDNFAHIIPGSIQRYGETAMTLVFEMSKRLPTADRSQPVPVYFDLLGQVFISYSPRVGVWLHLAAGLVAVWMARRREAWLALGRLLVTLGIGLIAGLAPSLLLLAVGVPNALYRGRAWMLVLLVLLPCSAALAERSHERDLEGAPLLWGLILAALSLSNAPQACYFPFLCLVGCLAGRFLSGPARTLACLVPWILMVGLLVLANEFLTPISGRAGTIPPDLLSGGATAAVLVFLAALPPFPVPRMSRTVVLALVLAGCGLAVSTPRFTEEQPKRLFMQHVHRQAFSGCTPELTSTETAVWLITMDGTRLAPIADQIPADAVKTEYPDHTFSAWNPIPAWMDPRGIQPVTHGGVYGRVPFPLPLKSLCSGMWIPDDTEVLPASLTVESSSRPVEQGLNRTVLVRGPHMMFAAMRGVVAWSLGPVPKPRPDCDCQFILHSHGYAEPISAVREWSFWVVTPGPLELDIWGSDFEAGVPAAEKAMARKIGALPRWVSVATSAWSSHIHTYNFTC